MKECELIRARLAEYAVGGLRGRMRKRVEAHVGACSDCRAELTALERTGALLDSVGAQAAPAGTWEAVRLRILERPRARVRARPRWGWAMGAVALVAVVLAAFFIRPPAVQEPVVVTAVEVDEEMQATMDGHLSAVWAAPLSDVAGVGLRMATLEDDG
jgi:predicted anti-sigma-YlaC factor YlaD